MFKGNYLQRIRGSLLLLLLLLIVKLLLWWLIGRLLGLLSEFFNHPLHSVVELIWDIKRGELIDTKATFCLSEVHLIVKLALHNLIYGNFVEPFNTLSFFPEAELGLLTGHDIGSKTVLLAPAPVTRVCAAITPSIDTVAVLFVILVFAPVLPTVLPSVHTDSVHIIIDPFSLVLTAIQPSVGAQALDLVLLPFAIIPGTVVPAVDASPVLLACQVFALVDGAISPLFLALSVLEVLLPLTLVSGPIHMDIDALAVCLIIDPISLVNIPIDMGELSKPMGPVVLPVAFVAGAVRPDLFTIAISETTDPLSRILGARRISVCSSLLTLSIWIVRGVRDRFFQLNRCKVPAISSFGLLDHIDLHPGRVSAPQGLKSHDGPQMWLELLQTHIFLDSWAPHILLA